jgi:Leucine-rich repeat (LRR) protein
LNRLERIDGELRVTETWAKSLTGLDRLYSAKSIVIDSNAKLSDIRAIGTVNSVNRVVFSGNPNLTSFWGFAPVSTLDELDIDNSGFTSLAGLERLRKIRSLKITNNQRLISVRSLRYVTHIDELILERNGRICAQLGFFGGLQQPPATSVIRHNPTVFDNEIARLRSGTQMREMASSR